MGNVCPVEDAHAHTRNIAIDDPDKVPLEKLPGDWNTTLVAIEDWDSFDIEDVDNLDTSKHYVMGTGTLNFPDDPQGDGKFAWDFPDQGIQVNGKMNDMAIQVDPVTGGMAILANVERIPDDGIVVQFALLIHHEEHDAWFGIWVTVEDAEGNEIPPEEGKLLLILNRE